jgi:hypothetical protein
VSLLRGTDGSNPPPSSGESANSPFLLHQEHNAKGHQLVGTTLLSIGDYATAFPHLERAVAFCAPEEHRTPKLAGALIRIIASIPENRPVVQRILARKDVPLVHAKPQTGNVNRPRARSSCGSRQ